ncbi:MAG TPA: DUF488 domain-containing protein [Usitatibacter sp.]|nr:DUF488 domain-containing protein [Usitatibacter sp.]
MPEPFFTIGHSTRTLEEFVALLEPNGVRRVIDVRSVPRSRTNPQYNKDSLPASLAPHGIGYEHIAALGGLRGRKADVPPEVNGFWENRSFHNYADYAMSSAAFREGLERLLQLGRRERCAIMCAESVWWRCHRRIITDYLMARGEAVFHIVSGDVPEPARLTAEARPAGGGGLAYPAAQAGLGL